MILQMKFKMNRKNYFVYLLLLLGGLLNILNGCKGHEEEEENPVNENTVTDIDGNVYQTIKIGTQVWMAENLKVAHYRNGEEIETTTPVVLNVSEQTLPFQWDYSDKVFFKEKDSIYGRLYNWYAVRDPRNICPNGWHIPTESEWATLIDSLGGQLIAGGKMKMTGTIYWESPNLGATDKIGFSAVPGGIRYANGGLFQYIGKECNYWTSPLDPTLTTGALICRLHNERTTAFITGLYIGHAASVRCIKDQ